MGSNKLRYYVQGKLGFKPFNSAGGLKELPLKQVLTPQLERMLPKHSEGCSKLIALRALCVYHQTSCGALSTPPLSLHFDMATHWVSSIYIYIYIYYICIYIYHTYMYIYIYHIYIHIYIYTANVNPLLTGNPVFHLWPFDSAPSLPAEKGFGRGTIEMLMRTSFCKLESFTYLLY